MKIKLLLSIFLTNVLAADDFSDAKGTASKNNTEILVEATELYKTSSDAEAKKNKVKEMLEFLEKKTDFENKEYWQAVFLTFDCEIRDLKRLIPFCIISQLSEIKKLLNHAHQIYPSYNHYAPARTLGIMYMKMPALVGGSYKKSLEYLNEAYKGAPDYPENKKWLDELKSQM